MLTRLKIHNGVKKLTKLTHGGDTYHVLPLPFSPFLPKINLNEKLLFFKRMLQRFNSTNQGSIDITIYIKIKKVGRTA